MVARSPVSPRPANLHDGFGWCALHQEAWHRAVKRGCPKCGASRPSMPAERRVARPRAGAVHEIALRAALVNAGYVDAHALRSGVVVRADALFVVEFTWLPGERLYRFDVAFPALKVAVDVDGGAHAAGKAKLRADTERRGLAAAHGWRIVAVTPEQVRDGTAVDLVKAALAAKEGNRV